MTIPIFLSLQHVQTTNNYQQSQSNPREKDIHKSLVLTE